MKLAALPLLLTPVLLLNGCRKEKEAIPECIQTAITSFSKNSCESGARVEQYQFEGKMVYTFFMGFCGGDLPTFVKDEACHTLGYLGGLEGNTKINGTEFSNAQHVRTLWSRP